VRLFGERDFDECVHDHIIAQLCEAGNDRILKIKNFLFYKIRFSVSSICRRKPAAGGGRSGNPLTV
jgi:hypothetical protein